MDPEWASVRERLEQEKCDRGKGNVETMAMESDGRMHYSWREKW